MAEKDSEKEIERLYTIPLRRVKLGSSSMAAPRAVKFVRSYITKHMKVEEESVWIDDSLNKELWSRGKYKIPSKIRVRAVKFEDGVVEVTLPELGVKKSRREILKEEKEKKTPILRREEVSEEEGVPGAEDYDIAPAADGEVKIKKKKAPKEEKPKEDKKTEKKSDKKQETKKEEKTKKTEKSTKPKKSDKKEEKKKPAKKSTTKKKATPKKTKK